MRGVLWTVKADDKGVQCIQELRCKARYFEETAIIPTLDACASVAKSDSIVSKDLHDGLKDAFDRLKREQSAEPDWHPRSGEMVQDLVHPSMYPLVYGRSRVFRDECVGVEDAVHAWAGKGDVISKQEEAKPVRQPFWSSEVPPEYWSSTYQWLPANVAFSQDGGVRFTSYINNLHPNRYPDIYRTIEKLIETSLPLWDQCLAIGIDLDCTEGAGRLDPRIDMPGSAESVPILISHCSRVAVDTKAKTATNAQTTGSRTTPQHAPISPSQMKSSKRQVTLAPVNSKNK